MTRDPVDPAPRAAFPTAVALTFLAAFLGLASFLLKDALFLGGAFYERDLLSLYAPTAEAFVRSVSQGALPLRDTTTAFGQPLLGNPDAQIPYPLTWLNLVMLPDRAYSWIALFHYLLGATGAAALAWRFVPSRLGSFFAGVFWLISGPFQSFLAIWHHLAGAAWMPWVLTAFDRLLETPDRRWVAIVGGVFGLQVLAGSADMCAMTLGLALLRWLCEARGTMPRALARQFGMALVALLVAAGLGAATWLTVGEIYRASQRASLPESVRTYWSIHPAVIAEFVLPLRLGSMNLAQGIRDLLFDGREPLVKSLYLGPIVAPLFLAGVLSLKIPRKYRAFAALGVLTVLLVSLGRYTPVYEMAMSLVPPLKIFRYPSKLAIPVSLLTCVMAGAALGAWAETRVRRTTAVVSIVLAVLHGVLWCKLSTMIRVLMPPQDVAIQELAVHSVASGLLLSLVVLSATLLSSWTRRPWAVALASALSVGATVNVNGGLNPVVEQNALHYRPDYIASLQTSQPSRIFVEDYAHFPDRSQRFLGRAAPLAGMTFDGLATSAAFVAGARSTLVPPVGGMWGLEYAWDMDLRGLFDGVLRDLTLTLHANEEAPSFKRMLQLANVSHVVALHSSSFSALPLETTIHVPPLLEPLYVFGVPGSLPRVYAVSGASVRSSKDAAELVLGPDFDPRTQVVVDQGDPTPIAKDFQSSAVVVERGANRIVIEAALSNPGWVVLLEGYLPGWSATVDGASAPVRRANAVFVGVAADAGTHRVVFLYRPWSAVIGLSLSTFFALMILFSVARP